MAYGSIKVDQIVFTNGGVDTTVTVSGLSASTSGSLTVTGTVSGNTANFVSGNFSSLISGATITGTSVQAITVAGTSGTFTTLTGTTTSGTNANFVSGNFSTRVSGLTVAGTSGTFTTLTGTTTTGTTANFVSGVFTTTVSGAAATIGVATITSGVFPAGSATAPSVQVSTGTTYNPGIYSPGTDQVAISTNGTGRLFVSSAGNVGVGIASAAQKLEVANSIDTTFTNLPTNVRLSNSGTIAAGLGAGIAFAANLDNTINTVYAAIAGIRENASVSSTAGALVFGVRDSSGGVNIERLRITSGGLVGIGTSAPNYQLHVTTGFAVGAAGFSQHLTFSDDTIQSLLLGTGYTPLKLNPLGGNVGIGSSSPSTTLAVAGGISGTAGINVSGSGWGVLPYVANSFVVDSIAGQTRLFATGTDASTHGNLLFFTGTTNGTASERARIDSSGRVLVGTSSSSVNTRLVVNGNSASPAGTGVMHLQYGSSTTNILSNYTIADLNYADSNGNVGAQIKATADANWGASSFATRLVFSTTADGAASPTERMRINNAGLVAINTTAKLDGNSVSLAVGASYPATPVEIQQNATSSHFCITFRNANGLVGSISTAGSATAFNTSSDYRLKENVVPLTGAADRVKQLQVHRFNFLADPDKTVDGFIAHEAQAIVPECVTGTKDEVGADGKPVYQGIDQSKLVPLLTAALQEALAKIATLEQRLADAGIA